MLQKKRTNIKKKHRLKIRKPVSPLEALLHGTPAEVQRSFS
jgi:hypothetical protein